MLKDEPDWESLPGGDSAALRRVLRRCLEKSARARLPHIGSARLEFEEALVEARAPAPTRARAMPSVHPGGGLFVALGLVLGFVVGAAVVYFWRGVAEPSPNAGSPSPFRYTVSLAELRPPLAPTDVSLRVSPDGSLLAVTAGSGPGGRIYVRRRGSLELEPVAGTHGAWYMEFSPDGRWMLFGVVNRDVLQRVPVSGGAPLLVLGNDAELGEWGWDWDGNEHVVYSTLSGLRRATVSGGEVEVLTSTGGPRTASSIASRRSFRTGGESC